MSAEAALQALLGRFQELCALNRGVLAALRGESPRSTLKESFERKAVLCEGLNAAQAALGSHLDGAAANPLLSQVLQAQREAVLLETQVAELLESAVARVAKVAVYKKMPLEARRERLDHSI